MNSATKRPEIDGLIDRVDAMLPKRNVLGQAGTSSNPVHSRKQRMTIPEYFARAWEMLLGRADGPLTLRLIFQPTVAAIFAIRAGLKDAREGRTPYLWSVFANPAHRRDLLREGWKDIGTVFLIAVVLDVIYALIVHRWIYPVQALLVGTVLAIVPYLLIRGPVTRIARRLRGA